MNALTWSRAGRTRLVVPCDLDTTPAAAADIIREAMAWLTPLVERDDVLGSEVNADFGPAIPLHLPACNYAGTGAQLWLTRCEIDGSKSKNASTPGFVLAGNFHYFRRFKLRGDCWNKQEDGGLVGYTPDQDFDAELTFDDCLIDAEGADWGVFTWKNRLRKIRARRTRFNYCRFGIAAAGSGLDGQEITIEDCQFVGDANPSASFGASSKMKDDDGVLTAVLNRGGDTTIRRSTFAARGLVAQYDKRPAVEWGCPRIAVIATNHYSGAPHKTRFTIEDCRVVSLEPGTATVCNDLDVRYDAPITITNRIGSNLDGSLKQWQK